MIKERIYKAYVFAKKKHSGQMRKNSKLEYITHPKYVARIVEQLTKSEDLVIAALLHDTLEDTDTTYKEIVEEFGPNVAHIVDELTNKKEDKGSLSKKKYILYKMSIISNDALTVKLADRFHNILFLEKDCTSNKELQFIAYYYKNTRFIMDNLYNMRIEKGNDVDTIHNILIDGINIVLNNLQVKYGF